jgi:sec-independent protein translocase protein TatB
VFGVGGQELFIIALVALILLGPERIPAFARGAARAWREFTKVRRQVDHTLSDLRAEIDLDEDSRADTLVGQTRRVPLDQLHTVEADGRLPAPRSEPLSVPTEDDYLSGAGVPAREQAATEGPPHS